MVEIKSYWQTETGRFSKEYNTFVNRKYSEVTEKTLQTEVKVADFRKRLVLYFIGGPTGYESYYIDDIKVLLEEKRDDLKWVICAGTINSWPRCWVKVGDLKKVIRYYTEKANEQTKA